MAEKSLGLLAANPSNSWTALHGAWLDSSAGHARILLMGAARGAAADVDEPAACELFRKCAAALEDLDRKGQQLS